MQALILAAGMGRRLRDLTSDNTKCMLKINGIRLIDRTLDCLANLGLDRVILVVGYKRENVKKHVGYRYRGMEITYVENDIYDRTNNIYSLYLAKDYLINDDTLLLESDLIFEQEVVKRILENEYPNLALVDKYESWMDGTVVTIDDDNHIENFISKKHFKYSDIDGYYKTVNIYKFSKEFSRTHYVPFLEAYCNALGNNEYYEQVLRVITLLEDSPLKALPLNGEKWYEIDDVQDLDIASGMFVENAKDKLKAVAGRYGGYWRYPHMLDFCYLVNPYFPNQNMIDEMKASFEHLLREYPSGMSVNSLLAAKSFYVDRCNIVVGNGAVELIKALVENHVGNIGMVHPTFEEYSNRIVDGKLVCYVPSNADYHYSADDIMEYFSDRKELDTILLINPDNPSGNYIPYPDLLKLIDWTRERNIRFVVDESFVDFVDAEGQITLIDSSVLNQNQHLVVVKSISKSYGVPGLRLGVLVSGDTDLITRLKKDVAIWNINSFGEFFLQIYEKYHADYLESCIRFRQEREIFKRELSEIPFLRVIPSQANYFLCEVATEYFTSQELAVRLLADFNILIKDCSTKKGFWGKDYVRLAVRNREDNHRLVEALKTMICE